MISLSKWYRTFLALFVGITLISSGFAMAPVHTALDYKGATLALSNLPLSTPDGRETLFSLSWGNGKDQLGLFEAEGFEGPMNFDIGEDGTIAILDQVNSRVQIYSEFGVLQHTISVPRTATHLWLTPTSVIITEPWNTREVIEYDFMGNVIGTTTLPDDIEWPKDIFVHNSIVYAEAGNQLVALPFPGHAAATAEQQLLSGRPMQSNPGVFYAFGGFEDNSQAVRLVRQGPAGVDQIKLALTDRQILLIEDSFTDQDGNHYIQPYLSETLERSDNPSKNPVALLKLDREGRYIGAFLQPSDIYTHNQLRRFSVNAQGNAYQMEATAQGVTLYRLKFAAVGKQQFTAQRFADLPQDLITEPPARVNAVQSDTANIPPKTNTELIDHTAAQPWAEAGGAPPTVSDDATVMGHPSGPYSGPPPITRNQVIEIAKSAVGSNYVWGGEEWNPFDRNYRGADCSGLVSTAWQVDHARPTTEAATSRPDTNALLNQSTHWNHINVSNRQRGDAFTDGTHAFIFEANSGSTDAWVYESFTEKYKIKHYTRPLSGFAARQRKNLDGVGIVGRDKGWIYGMFIDVYNNLGGEAAVGHPFDNGGSILVHRWHQGYVQDVRGGSRGQGSLMHGDAVGSSYLVHGSIYWTYMGMGGPGSWLGWPVSNEEPFHNGCKQTVRQRFQHGYITENCNTGKWEAVRN